MVSQELVEADAKRRFKTRQKKSWTASSYRGIKGLDRELSSNTSSRTICILDEYKRNGLQIIMRITHCP